MTTSNPPKTGTVTGVDIIVHLTGDPERSIAYYRDVLGMEPTELDEKARGAEFTLADGTTFGVWKPDDVTTSGATIMFAVENAKDAVALFRSRGAEISDVNETPVCYMAFGTDPDGNNYMVHQRKVSD
jgi:predicted enzyme related to lactoylglutathione lyase